MSRQHKANDQGSRLDFRADTPVAQDGLTTPANLTVPITSSFSSHLFSVSTKPDEGRA